MLTTLCHISYVSQCRVNFKSFSKVFVKKEKETHTQKEKYIAKNTAFVFYVYEEFNETCRKKTSANIFTF